MATTPRYEPCEARAWRRDDGRTASIFGAAPWHTAEEGRRWESVRVGWTVRNLRTGTVGVGRQPFATRAEAEAWIRMIETL